ncbi:hypothetical protein PFLUV_G00127950 [Perca fluviatilis]|uniref:Uncharacterized protein n=1 Tax=Perca fluviatilis TaxID=8168 RepID=A0A6A5EXY0_PERFL|nr:hypothetical protein PFLUV_G00127950 [Perca fluviatilis]
MIQPGESRVPVSQGGPDLWLAADRPLSTPRAEEDHGSQRLPSPRYLNRNSSLGPASKGLRRDAVLHDPA